MQDHLQRTNDTCRCLIESLLWRHDNASSKRIALTSCCFGGLSAEAHTHTTPRIAGPPQRTRVHMTWSPDPRRGYSSYDGAAAADRPGRPTSPLGRHHFELGIVGLVDQVVVLPPREGPWLLSRSPVRPRGARRNRLTHRSRSISVARPIRAPPFSQHHHLRS